jgi:hypothetical protein
MMDLVQNFRGTIGKLDWENGEQGDLIYFCWNSFEVKLSWYDNKTQRGMVVELTK